MSYFYFSHDKVRNMRKYIRIHNHRNHELYYLVGGKTKYVIGDEIFNVGKGDIVIIPKDILHMTDSEECLENERYLFSFDDEVFDSETACLLDELLTHRLVHVPANRREQFDEIVSAIERNYGREDQLSRATLKVHVMELVSYICHYGAETTPNVKEPDEVVHRISDYINVNFKDDISLHELSRIFAFSESYISRKFKNVTGVGISEYITFVRIMNAERLLRSGNYSITKIAQMCGFNDSNYFSSVFKRIKGITPLKFAKNAKELG